MSRKAALQTVNLAREGGDVMAHFANAHYVFSQTAACGSEDRGQQGRIPEWPFVPMTPVSFRRLFDPKCCSRAAAVASRVCTRGSAVGRLGCRPGVCLCSSLLLWNVISPPTSGLACKPATVFSCACKTWDTAERPCVLSYPGGLYHIAPRTNRKPQAS